MSNNYDMGKLLPKRLQAILKHIPIEGAVVDIGTDHGLIPIALALRGQKGTVIGSDSRVGPLQAAQDNVAAYGLVNQIELRLGHGLEVVSFKEVDVAVMAGMGGQNIMASLGNKLSLAQEIPLFVLQPMRDSKQVRHWLVANNFTIFDEDIVQDRGLYEVIVTGPGKHLDDLQIAAEIGVDYTYILGLGPQLVAQKHPLLWELLSGYKNDLSLLVKNMGTSCKARARRETLKLEQRQLEKVIRWLSR